MARGFSPHGASCAPRGGRTCNQPRHARSCAQQDTVDVVELGHGGLGRHDHDLLAVHGGQEHLVDQADHGPKSHGRESAQAGRLACPHGLRQSRSRRNSCRWPPLSRWAAVLLVELVEHHVARPPLCRSFSAADHGHAFATRQQSLAHRLAALALPRPAALRHLQPRASLAQAVDVVFHVLAHVHGVLHGGGGGAAALGVRPLPSQRARYLTM